MRLRLLMIGLTLAASLAIATGAHAVVLTDAGDHVGVALVPGTRGSLPAGISIGTSTGPCTDPWLAPDLSLDGIPQTLPDDALCWHGGAVMHRNETFAIAWDPDRQYWATVRGDIQQFLQNVASGSGTGTSGAALSPYAVTSQYGDGAADPSGVPMNPPDPDGKALNASVYGGGCIDFGATGGFTCKFGDTGGTGQGDDYPQQAHCTPDGTNQFFEAIDGSFTSAPNNECLTDADIRGELTSMLPRTQVVDRTVPGYTPLVVVLTPPGIEVCIDSQHKLCSANSESPASFCSYHGQVAVPNGSGGSTNVAYLVQPWVASWPDPTGCDDASLKPIPTDPAPDTTTLAHDVSASLVSPLSQAEMAAIVDPDLNGWSALDGSEINDNGCVPFPGGLDAATVGGTGYFLQREFNNAGVIESDPNALSCTGSVNLVPSFVVPSAVNKGDEVQFDGSTTNSTLIVPKAGYSWSFGDGTTASGPSVVHAYPAGGDYSVTLTVTDRGDNVAVLTQTIHVLGADGQPTPPPDEQQSSQGKPTSKKLTVQLQLVPQALKTVLSKGVSVRVTSNQAANGIATLSIPRSAAKKAHLRAGHHSSLVIGRGTVSGIKSGTVALHLKLSRSTAKRLSHLKHLQLSVRMSLVSPDGSRVAVDVAGRY